MTFDKPYLAGQWHLSVFDTPLNAPPGESLGDAANSHLDGGVAWRVGVDVSDAHAGLPTSLSGHVDLMIAHGTRSSRIFAASIGSSEVANAVVPYRR
jgi:hypothetical protein